MSSRERTFETHRHLQQELQRERCAALGRIAGRLERLVDRLATLRQNLAGAAGPDRVGLARDYGMVRDEARRYRWYLEVQREALGLRRHDTLDEHYPIPGPLERDPDEERRP